MEPAALLLQLHLGEAVLEIVCDSVGSRFAHFFLLAVSETSDLHGNLGEICCVLLVESEAALFCDSPNL